MSSGKFTEYPYVGEIHFGLIADRPVQLNYEYCKGCGKQGLGCIQPHRFFTFEGWLTIWLALLETPPYTKHQVMDAAYQAERFFPGGFDGGEIGRCIVCRRTDCSRPHRKYTREGYAKYQIELMGIPREEAMKRANEEFRVYGGDWAFYPHHGEFGPPKEYDPPAQVVAPPPPPEGWPRVNDDRYVNIMKTVRQTWKTVSEGKSEADLLRLRDEFDQRWANMSGEVPPMFHMSWDHLPRPSPDTGDGSRGQYAGTGGGFGPPNPGQEPMPGAHFGGGMPGYASGRPQPGAQSGNPFDAYKNIPGMPSIFFSGSGGGTGFTFHHHAGGQSQSYKFLSDRERRRRRRRRSYEEDEQAPREQQPPPRKPEYAGPNFRPKETVSKDGGSGVTGKKREKEQSKESPVDNPFNDSVQWYAKTFLEKTKAESVATTRLWAETLCKKFVNEWGAWARTVEMPWDQDPRLKENNEDVHGGDGARSPKDRSSRSRGNMDGYNTSRNADGGLPVGDSFARWAKNWNRSQKQGSRDGYKPPHTTHEEAFEERFNQSRKFERRTADEDAFEDRYKKSTRSERHRKDDRPYKPSSKDRDTFEDRFKAWQKSGADNPYVDAFDERYQKWKESGAAANPDMEAFDERYGKWSNKRAREKRRDYSDESDYDGDASIGPPYPKAPRGAGNEDYENTCQEFEEMWTRKSRDRRKSELQDLRVAMEYAWLQQVGHDGRGKMMPWHSHYRKYVRRPAGSRFATARKKADNSYNRSRTDTSYSKPNQDDSSNYRPDPGVRERDRTDASYLKPSQDHARTGMNERQSRPHGGQPLQPKETSGTGTNENKGTERPYVYRSRAERQSDKLSKADQKYEEHKTKCSTDWDAARARTSGSPDELRKLAQMHQVKFEYTTDDERPKTEVMPWARYIRSDKPSTSASLKPDSPNWNREGENKKPTEPTKPTSKPTSKPTNTTKPAKPNLPLFGMDRMYEKHKADLTEEWQRISKNATSEAALKKLAQVNQMKFEATIDDPRAKTEIMPWRKNIRGDDNGAYEPPKPPKPTPPKDDTPKPKPDSKKGPDQPLDRYKTTKEEFSKDWERMRAAKMTTGSNIPLKKLAQQHQVKFESAIHDPRTKTDILPWTKYIHGDTEVKEDPFAIPPSKPKSSTPKPAPTSRLAAPSTGDSYDKHKSDFVRESEEFCKTTSSPAALRRQVQIQQVKFEGVTKEERAKYEAMSWSKYTGVKPGVAPAAPQPLSPDAPKASASKPAAPTSSNTDSHKPKGDDIVDKLMSQKPVSSSDEANLLKYERCVTRFNAKWDTLCENSPGVSRRELARKIQKSFEKSAADDRAKTEEMPWSCLLEGKPVPSVPTSQPPQSQLPSIFKQKNVPTKKDTQPDVGAGADEKYSKLKADCIQKWEEESKPITSPAALRGLAQVHQVKFEHWDDGDRAKTEEMPWSKYLRLGTTAKPEALQPQNNVPPKPAPPPSQPKEPSRDTSKQQPLRPALTPDQAYAKHKAVFTEEWTDLSARTKSQVAFRKPAKDLQLRFKHQTEDERAKTEVMPWWMYLKKETSTSQGATNFPKPDSLQPNPPLSQTQKGGIPPASEKPALPKLDTKSEFEKPKKPSGYHSFKKDPSKQPTVETEPPSPERYSSTDAISEKPVPVIPAPAQKAPTSPLVPGVPATPAKKTGRRSSGVLGIQYEMLKGRFETDWDVKNGKHSESDYSGPAKAIQAAFEEASKNTRSKTEIMPWTKYLKVAKAPPIPAGGDSANAAQRERDAQKGAAKPERKTSVQKDLPKPAVPPAPEKAATSPARPRAQKSAYDRSKANFEMKWLLLQENAEGYDLPRPAKNIQRAFEEETADGRAKTEVMPWSRYLKDEQEAPKIAPGSPGYDSASIYSSESPFAASPKQWPVVPVSHYDNIKTRFEATWDLKKEGYEEEDYAELAVGMQKSFEKAADDERAKTELMPWTMYLPVGFSSAPKGPAPSNLQPHKSRDNVSQQQPVPSFTGLEFEEPREPENPPIPDEKQPEHPKPPTKVRNPRYENHKALYGSKWDTLLETRKGESRVPLAKKIQKAFETKANDDRAKTQKMPWTKYLGLSGVVEQTKFVPPPEPKAEPFPPPIKPPPPSHPVRHDETPPPAPRVRQPPWSEPPIPKQPPPHERPPLPEGSIRPSIPLSYDEEVAYATKRWDRLKEKYPDEDIAVLAQKRQRGFEGASTDERAKEQMMPWTRFLPDWHLHVRASAAYDMRPKKEPPRPLPTREAREPLRDTARRTPQERVKEPPAQPRDSYRPSSAPAVTSKPNPAPNQSLAEYKVQYEAWYDNCKRNIAAKWGDEFLKHDGDDHTSLARQFQAAFEGTGDSRAQSAAMPWTVYLSAQPKPTSGAKPVGLGLYTAGSVKTIGGDRSAPAPANDPEARYEERKAKRIDYWWHKYDKHRGEDHTQCAIFSQGKFEDETDYKWARAQPMPWDKYLPRSGKHSKPKAREKHDAPNEVRVTLPTEERTFKVSVSVGVAYGVGDDDETYEQCKLRYIKNWNVISDASKEKNRPAAARKIQRKFVEQTEDDRFHNEVMPWQTYLSKRAEGPKVSKPERYTSTKKGLKKVKIAKWKLPKEDKHRSSKHAKDKPKHVNSTSKRAKKTAFESDDEPGPVPETAPAGIEVEEDDEEEEPYEERKERYAALWPYKCEGKKGKELADFAAKMQKDWVRHAQHEQATNEVMPWQKHLTKAAIAELKDLKPKFMASKHKGRGKELSKRKRSAEPPSNVHGPVRNAVFKLNYDCYIKNWNEMYADKPRNFQISAATEFRKVWLEKVGTRAHEVRMPWDDVLDVREDRGEDANFNMLSVRLGRDRFDSIRDGAGEDQEGVDWEQLFNHKKAAERAERKRKEGGERRSKQQEGCGQQ